MHWSWQRLFAISPLVENDHRDQTPFEAHWKPRTCWSSSGSHLAHVPFCAPWADRRHSGFSWWDDGGPRRHLPWMGTFPAEARGRACLCVSPARLTRRRIASARLPAETATDPSAHAIEGLLPFGDPWDRDRKCQSCHHGRRSMTHVGVESGGQNHEVMTTSFLLCPPSE
ncbi:hypothetical protein VTK73DRAFT_3874 [Phialemonium thermophilum]|uniref:Uncharacterized protein n=1 Tax=Phialemonium thermophilum TaxID=223376 RepID=A0ABR3VE18_9PEZI